MACIHYKFNSMMEYKTLIFEGLHITVADLKRDICEREVIGKEFDLRLTNAQTKHEYQGEHEIVPRNSSIVVARIPAATGGKLPKIQCVFVYVYCLFLLLSSCRARSDKDKKPIAVEKNENEGPVCCIQLLFSV